MKKGLALFLVCAVLLAVPGCGLLPAHDTTTNTSAGSSADADAVDTATLWAGLEGVWSCSDGCFIQFHTDGETLRYTTGVLNAGGQLDGTLVSADKRGDSSYLLQVAFPAATGTDREVTESIELNWHFTSQPRTIDATDVATKHGVRTFTYNAPTLETAVGPAAAKSLTQQEVWARFAGIWAYRDSNDLLRFVCFSTESGQGEMYSLGTLFSGELIGGPITSFKNAAGASVCTFQVDVPAEEGEGYSRAAAHFDVTVDWTDFDAQKMLRVVNSSGGDVHAYKYVASSFATLGDMEDVLKAAA